MPREVRSSADAVLLALSHPVRRQILEKLSGGPKPFYEIANSFDMTRPAVRDHLYVLRDAGLVAGQGHGRGRRYALVGEAPLVGIKRWLAWWEEAVARGSAGNDGVRGW
jgi:DNA-binding transcriptional ArsR family regulator